MSAVDQARLRELAEAATQGEWHTAATDDSLILCGRTKISSTFALPGDDWGYDNAAFIAAANPATILALLAALSAERERGDRAVGLADYAAHDEDCTVNRYPGHDACSCGLSLILQFIRHDLATQKAEGA